MLLKGADPSTDVVVFERNRPGDTFGFGVVFSDATLRGIDDVDPVLLRALTDHGVHWNEIEVRIHGERWRAVADSPVPAGQTVTVAAVEGLTLRVRKES